MSEHPLVSIVIPCLNRAHYLIPTIESILQQDYPGIECIVIDGGSTDGTLELLKSYGGRIKWISEPDGGHADAINKGWKMSRGEILAWLNADDCYVVPDAVSRAVDYFQKNPDVDVIYGDYARLSDDGKIVSDIIKPRAWDLDYAVKYCHYTIPQPASFMRRSILERAGWLDPEFRHSKDHELWLRIGLVGTIRYVPFFLAYARICSGLSQQKETSASKVRLTEKFFSIPGLPPPFGSKKYRRRALSNSYLVGSLYALDGRSFTTALEYLSRAFVTDPLNLPHILFEYLSKPLLILLPFKFKQNVKRMLKCSGVYSRD